MDPQQVDSSLDLLERHVKEESNVVEKSQGYAEERSSMLLYVFQLNAVIRSSLAE